MKNSLKKVFVSSRWSILIWIALLVVIWEGLAFYVETQFRSPENVLPHLYQIIEAFFSTEKVASGKTVSDVVFSSAAVTLSRAILGFGIGIILGFVLALLMDLSKVIDKIAFPYLMIIQMIPILGMGPIVYAMTKNINTTRIIIAAILTFYPVCINVLSGFKSVEKEKYDLMNLAVANKFQLYTKTKIPGCIPYFFTGLKIAAPMAITASILVDTLQGGGGIGCMLSQSLKGAMSRYVFWSIVLFSAFIGIFSTILMGIIERLLCPYKYGRKRRKKVSDI